MKIGDIDLGRRPLLLAPMEDVTDASFRILCREQGAAAVYTEFVPSDALVRDVEKSIAKMRTLEEEAPVASRFTDTFQRLWSRRPRWQRMRLR